MQDKQHHINYLELLAASYALKGFASHSKGSEILLSLVISIVISYINRIDSIKFPSLSKLAREIWCWCTDEIYSFMPLISLRLRSSKQTRDHALSQRIQS